MKEYIVHRVWRSVPTPAQTTDIRLVGADDVKTHTVLPGWQDIISVGHDATTTYSSEFSSIRPGYGPITYVDPKDSRNFHIDIDAIISPNGFPAWSSSALSLAQARYSTFVAKKKVSALETVAGGVILGELGKTVHQLAHPFNGFMRLTRDYLERGATIRQRILKNAVNRSWKRIPRIPPSVLDRSKINMRALNRELNNAYLEYTYAVGPTMHDIDSVVQELSSHHLSHEEPFHAYGVADTMGGGLQGDFSTYGTTAWLWYLQYYEVAEVKGFAKILVDLTQNRSMTLGTYFPQFVPTLWELIPYSFVADYVSNVQEVINGFCYPDPRCRYGYTNTRQRQFGSWSMSGELRTGQSKNGWTAERPPSYFERTKLTRGTFNWDPPRLILEAPTLKQSINMASLLLARLL